MPDAKRILIVVSRNWISQLVTQSVLDKLTEWGFEAMIIRTGNPYHPSVQVFRLDDLPEADLERVKKLVEEAH
jgi:hypothetical protein